VNPAGKAVVESRHRRRPTSLPDKDMYRPGAARRAIADIEQINHESLDAAIDQLAECIREQARGVAVEEIPTNQWEIVMRRPGLLKDGKILGIFELAMSDLNQWTRDWGLTFLEAGQWLSSFTQRPVKLIKGVANGGVRGLEYLGVVDGLRKLGVVRALKSIKNKVSSFYDESVVADSYFLRGRRAYDSNLQRGSLNQRDINSLEYALKCWRTNGTNKITERISAHFRLAQAYALRHTDDNRGDSAQHLSNELGFMQRAVHHSELAIQEMQKIVNVQPGMFQWLIENHEEKFTKRKSSLPNIEGIKNTLSTLDRVERDPVLKQLIEKIPKTFTSIAELRSIVEKFEDVLIQIDAIEQFSMDDSYAADALLAEQNRQVGMIRGQLEELTASEQGIQSLKAIEAACKKRAELEEAANKKLAVEKKKGNDPQAAAASKRDEVDPIEVYRKEYPKLIGKIFKEVKKLEQIQRLPHEILPLKKMIPALLDAYLLRATTREQLAKLLLYVELGEDLPRKILQLILKKLKLEKTHAESLFISVYHDYRCSAKLIKIFENIAKDLLPEAKKQVATQLKEEEDNWELWDPLLWLVKGGAGLVGKGIERIRHRNDRRQRVILDGIVAVSSCSDSDSNISSLSGSSFTGSYETVVRRSFSKEEAGDSSFTDPVEDHPHIQGLTYTYDMWKSYHDLCVNGLVRAYKSVQSNYGISERGYQFLVVNGDPNKADNRNALANYTYGGAKFDDPVKKYVEAERLYQEAIYLGLNEKFDRAANTRALRKARKAREKRIEKFRRNLKKATLMKAAAELVMKAKEIYENPGKIPRAQRNQPREKFIESPIRHAVEKEVAALKINLEEIEAGEGQHINPPNNLLYLYEMQGRIYTKLGMEKNADQAYSRASYAREHCQPKGDYNTLWPLSKLV